MNVLNISVVDGTSNYGNFFVRCSNLPDLSSGKIEALLCTCMIVCFICVFFLVIWMSLFCVVMLGEQLQESIVAHLKTSFPAVLI